MMMMMIMMMMMMIIIIIIIITTLLCPVSISTRISFENRNRKTWRCARIKGYNTNFRVVD